MKFFLILSFLLFNSFASLFCEINDKILMKVENNIVTNYEFKNKVLRLLMLSDTEVNQKNIDDEKLAFSGQPGKAVNAVILRDGKRKH